MCHTFIARTDIDKLDFIVGVANSSNRDSNVCKCSLGKNVLITFVA